MWELLAGAICVPLEKKAVLHRQESLLSLTGLLLIIFSVLAYDKTTRFPSIYALTPIIGASLILLFGNSDGIAKKVLSHKIFVGVGLISYSAYLWHQPLFAFLRITSRHEPDALQYCMLIVLTLVLSYFTWKYVETPFRNPGFLNQKGVFISMASIGGVLAAVGLAFHFQHGFPSRVYSGGNTPAANTYISYNQRVFEYKRDKYITSDKVRLLVLGNSAARDFVNMIAENLPLESLEIIYRDDKYGCLDLTSSSLASHLVTQADVIVFATWDARASCKGERSFLTGSGKKVFYAGHKRFGYNLNWLARASINERVLATNELSQLTLQTDAAIRMTVPKENYIDIIGKISDGKGSITITDEKGHLLSSDRTHLTKYGARFVGVRVLNNPRLLSALRMPVNLLSP